MGPMASQITGVPVVYSTDCSGGDQRKHQSSASMAFVWGIHRWPVNSPHKGPITRKMFPFDDVIMISSHATKYSLKGKICCNLAMINVIHIHIRVNYGGYKMIKYIMISHYNDVIMGSITSTNASNAENVSIRWRNRNITCSIVSWEHRSGSRKSHLIARLGNERLVYVGKISEKNAWGCFWQN